MMWVMSSAGSPGRPDHGHLLCVWLAHKAADVMSEVVVLGDRAGQLMELLSQIQVPERRFDVPDRGRRDTVLYSNLDN